jgi:hypothetical protein
VPSPGKRRAARRLGQICSPIALTRSSGARQDASHQRRRRESRCAPHGSRTCSAQQRSASFPRARGPTASPSHYVTSAVVETTSLLALSMAQVVMQDKGDPIGQPTRVDSLAHAILFVGRSSNDPACKHSDRSAEHLTSKGGDLHMAHDATHDLQAVRRINKVASLARGRSLRSAPRERGKSSDGGLVTASCRQGFRAATLQTRHNTSPATSIHTVVRKRCTLVEQSRRRDQGKAASGDPRSMAQGPRPLGEHSVRARLTPVRSDGCRCRSCRPTSQLVEVVELPQPTSFVVRASQRSCLRPTPGHVRHVFSVGCQDSPLPGPRRLGVGQRLGWSTAPRHP